MPAEIAGLKQRLRHRPYSAAVWFEALCRALAAQTQQRQPPVTERRTPVLGTSSTKRDQDQPEDKGALAKIFAHQPSPARLIGAERVLSPLDADAATTGRSACRGRRPNPDDDLRELRQPKMVGATKLPQLANRQAAKPANAPPIVNRRKLVAPGS